MCIYTQFDAHESLQLLCKHYFTTYNVQKYHNLNLTPCSVSMFTKYKKISKLV